MKLRHIVVRLILPFLLRERLEYCPTQRRSEDAAKNQDNQGNGDDKQIRKQQNRPNRRDQNRPFDEVLRSLHLGFQLANLSLQLVDVWLLQRLVVDRLIPIFRK
jgi:hypothetical protein